MSTEYLFKKLQEKVQQDYDLRDCVRHGDEEHIHEKGLIHQFLEMKKKLEDHTPLMGTSIPVELLETYTRTDCLECWLCNRIENYEFVPFFIWTENYLYLMDRSDDIRVIIINPFWPKDIRFGIPNLTKLAIKPDFKEEENNAD